MTQMQLQYVKVYFPLKYRLVFVQVTQIMTVSIIILMLILIMTAYLTKMSLIVIFNLTYLIIQELISIPHNLLILQIIPKPP
jgi:hypothetical protein